MPRVPKGLGNERGQLKDGDFLAGTNVDVAVADFGFARSEVGEVNMFHDEDTGSRHVFAPEKFSQWGTRSPKSQGIVAYSVSGDGVEYFFPGCLPGGGDDGAFVQIVADGIPISHAEASSKMDFADESRENMATFQIKVVVRPIEVGWHDSQVVGAVLDIEAFAHFESGNFGDGVSFVGVLQRGGEQGILGDGLWCQGGVDAGAAEEEEFFDSGAEAFPDDVLLDLQIVVDEVCPVRVVGHDAADVGRSQEDVFRLFTCKEFVDGNGVHQVQFPMASADQVGVAFCLEFTPDGGSDESAVSGDVDFAVFVHGARGFRLVVGGRRVPCRAAS